MEEACLDLGWQTLANGQPVVVKLPQYLLEVVEEFGWCKNDSSRYSMFGKHGMGAGGVTLTARPDSDSPVHMSKVYPGGWVHHIKALGLPPVAWNHATNRDMGLLKDKVQGLVNDLNTQSNHKMGGFRIEVRVQLAPTWDGLTSAAEEQVNAFLDYGQGLEVAKETILAYTQEGLSDSQARGWSVQVVGPTSF